MALADYHALGTGDAFTSCSREACPWASFLSICLPQQDGLIYSLPPSLLMSPLASLSLLSSRPVYLTDIGHLHSNIPWALRLIFAISNSLHFLYFSIARYSAPCKTCRSHAGLLSTACSPLYTLLVQHKGCPHTSEWSNFPLGQTCLSYFHFLPLISHLLSQLLPPLPKQFL